MAKYSFNEIEKMLSEMIVADLEPELSLFLHDKEYMIIGYKDRYSFQRCGTYNGSGELFYSTLEELFNSITIDNILLKRDWDNIVDFECTDY